MIKRARKLKVLEFVGDAFDRTVLDSISPTIETLCFCSGKTIGIDAFFQFLILRCLALGHGFPKVVGVEHYCLHRHATGQDRMGVLNTPMAELPWEVSAVYP